ncbi:MAG: DUF2062 domain-containing protein [Desulfuromonadaceae bacterium]|nr:DUF2062 domain-containing protein [Desulfuromonadaceae bacterium]
MWKRWGISRLGKLLFLRFIRLRGEPDEIAKGFALGIFIGMTPTMGFQMAIAVFFAMLLKENKFAAALAVWISNPLTAPFIYGTQYETGRFLLGLPHLHLPAHLTMDAFRHFGHDLMLPLFLGSLIHAILATGIAYALVLRLLPSLKAWRVPRWPKPFQHRHQK